MNEGINCFLAGIVRFGNIEANLTAQLQEQFTESDRLEQEIRKNLAGLGYDV